MVIEALGLRRTYRRSVGLLRARALCYAVAGYGLLRLFEAESRRRATLDLV